MHDRPPGTESEPTPQALRARARQLRSEAFKLLDGTGLRDLICRSLGPVEVVGSVDLDLMVWPDIDLYTHLNPGESARLISLLPALHDHLARQGWTVVKFSFNDEYRRPG